MSDYGRCFLAGGTYFFTVVTEGRAQVSLRLPPGGFSGMSCGSSERPMPVHGHFPRSGSRPGVYAGFAAVENGLAFCVVSACQARLRASSASPVT